MAQTTQNDSPIENAPSWRDEEQVLPKNRLGIVFLGLMCTVFLAALDQTIVATALPTIVAKLGGGNNYSWVGSAYLLGAGAFGPLYGKLSDMFGRKPIFYSSITIFLFGSTLCGAAQNMTWLIVCRAIQGMGGGGIMQLVSITCTDIVPFKDRGRYSGAIGSTFGIASVVGPLLGGVFAQHVSWRWCFFINLPTGGVAAAILFTSLNLNPHQSRPIRDQVTELDFIGLICFVAGVICLLIGFDFSHTSWSDARTIALLVIGIILLVAGAVNEAFTTRSAVIPARLFKTRTTAILLATTFVHGFVFFGTLYSLPLFYQVLGATPTGAGVKMILFSFGTSLASVVSGRVLSRMRRYRWIIRCSCVMMTLGVGLMIMLDYTSSLSEQLVFPLIASLGMGCLFVVPIIALQAAMPLKDMATASSGFMFIRTIGSAAGIAVSNAVIASVLPQSIPDISSFGIGTSVADLIDNIARVRLIPDVALRNAVLHAWSEAITTIWIMCTPLCGFVLILTFFLREYSMERKVVMGGEAKTCRDVEKDATRDLEAPKAFSGDPDVTPRCSDGQCEKFTMDKKADSVQMASC